MRKPKTSRNIFSIAFSRHKLSVQLISEIKETAKRTQRRNRLGDLNRIFLVGRSAPAGMTDRNMLDVMPINKTDRNNARGMAQMMRAGLYRPVHVKTLRSQKLRMLLTLAA